jgi:hypothetical protein
MIKSIDHIENIKSKKKILIIKIQLKNLKKILNKN